MKYTRTFTVHSHDISAAGYLRPTAVLREMQETAEYATAADGPSMAELRARGYAYVVARMTVSLYGDLFAGDTVEGETWAADLGGPLTCGRCYRLLKNGVPMAEAVASFALLDLASRRPVRVSAVPVNYRSDELLELDLPARLTLPPQERFSLVGERPVWFSETDRNGHMNNTRYADLVCDFLPAPQKRRPVRFSLSYLSEAAAGETLKVYRADAGDGVFFFRTVRRDGKTNLEAEIVTEETE
ncbi:MAG: hypothetical protein IJR89_04030 [Clostridia bacterium]|nr:hypothetical protein [Clostridia bacterium]